MDDRRWIQETSSLFDKLFGPDNFDFKTVKKCLVIPKACQPSFAYDHSIWEEQFRLPEVKPKARCSLEKSFNEAKASTSDKSSASDIWVPKWGGFAYLWDTVVIKLVNTCPIDNYLKEHPKVLYQLSQLAKDERYARCLNDVVQSFDDAATGAEKVHWLQQFPQFNFVVSSQLMFGVVNKICLFLVWHQLQLQH